MVSRRAVLTPRWALSRYRRPEPKVLFATAILSAICVVCAALAVRADRPWGACVAVGGAVVVLAAAGLRRPLGGIPAQVGVLGAFEGVAWGTTTLAQELVFIALMLTASLIFACLVDGPSSRLDGPK